MSGRARRFGLVLAGALAACGGRGAGEPRVEVLAGQDQQGFEGNFAAVAPTVRVLDAHGDPAVGAMVTFAVTQGGGTLASADVVASDQGEATAAWRFGPGPLQQVVASSLGASATVSASTTPPPASRFTIEIRHAGAPPSPAVQAALAAGAARWREIIVGDLADIVLSGDDYIGPIEVETEVPGIGTVTCVPRLEDQVIDDMVIYADIRPIDGASGANILGFAIPVVARNDFTTIAGCMVFDEANLAQLESLGRLGDLVLHEMAHVIGVGATWLDAGLLVGGCPAGAAEPYFAGSSARQAFRASLTAPFAGAIVPVEGNGPCFGGTRDSHWRESVFDQELMTGFIEAVGPNPLSAITAASLRDLRYTVNDAAADPFVVPSPGGVAARAHGARVELVEPHIKEEQQVVDETGRRQRRARAR